MSQQANASAHWGITMKDSMQRAMNIVLQDQEKITELETELKTFLQAASATDKYLVDVIQQSLGQPSEQEQIELDIQRLRNQLDNGQSILQNYSQHIQKWEDQTRNVQSLNEQVKQAVMTPST